MIDIKRSSGVSLIELMIAVGILGLIVAVAAPLYTDYVATSRESVLRNNIQSIRLFQDDYRSRVRSYVEGTYDPADPDAADGLKDLLGWEPGTEANKISYVVACETDTSDADDPNCLRASGYTVTATHLDYPDEAVCMGFAAPGEAVPAC